MRNEKDYFVVLNFNINAFLFLMLQDIQGMKSEEQIVINS